MPRRHIHCILFYIFSILTVAGCSTKTLETVDPPIGIQVPELNQREGLPNFFSKIKSGKEISVAYLGGSITEAKNGWRDMTFNWLKATYPQTSFKQIEAGVGGTGSDLGVFRMDKDILNYHPDLIFVEFAVNDNAATAETIYKAMEGIVRKTWKVYPTTDICFLYSIKEENVKQLQAGTYQPSAIAMEKIAEHYGIPSVQMGVPVVDLLNAGKLVFTGTPSAYPDKLVFTNDGVHPQSDAAHYIYALAVVRALSKMADLAQDKPHVAGTPYIQDNWEAAQMIPLSDITIKNNWEILPAADPISKTFVKYMPEIYKASAAGASFTVRFNGRFLGAYDLMGPFSSIIDIIVDGKPAIYYNRFDSYCNSYRTSSFLLYQLPEGDHEVKFLVTGKQFDKAAILLTRNITITDPEKYKENSWFVSRIMLIGKLK